MIDVCDHLSEVRREELGYVPAAVWHRCAAAAPELVSPRVADGTLDG
jgi:hypothetical protein